LDSLQLMGDVWPKPDAIKSGHHHHPRAVRFEDPIELFQHRRRVADMLKNATAIDEVYTVIGQWYGGIHIRDLDEGDSGWIYSAIRGDVSPSAELSTIRRFL